MRQFYLAFPIGHALSDQLSWTHYRIIMRETDAKARQWYMDECVACGWSTRELDRQVSTQAYARLLSSTNPDRRRKQVAVAHTIMPEHPKSLVPADFIKNPVMLEFLALPDDVKLRETELESAIISHLRNVLMELGYISDEEHSELAKANDRDKSAEFTERLKEEGYDSVFYNGDLRQEWVVFEPNQIKLADELTYDDAGNEIPSYLRFSKSDDIRYSVSENPETTPEASDLDAVSTFCAPDQVTQIATFLKPVVMNYGADAFGHRTPVAGDEQGAHRPPTGCGLRHEIGLVGRRTDRTLRTDRTCSRT